jgi:hypothetical protein
MPLQSKASTRGWLSLALALVSGATGLTTASDADAREAGSGSTTAGDRLALAFEANHGQFAKETRYLARGRGYQLKLGRAGVELRLAARAGEQPAELGLRIVGAASAEPRAEARLAGAYNYLIGSDARRWVTGVESYARVTYRDVRPGVDWVFYGKAQRELEYDLVLAPGTDVSTLALAFDGARGVSIDAGGRLRLELENGGELEQSPPVAYQLDAAGRRVLVAARFSLNADGSLGFRVGSYDRSRALVIDPTLSYATYFGGSGFEDGRAVSVDGQGSVYLTGSTSLGLFPITGAEQPTYGGGSSDAFVCKLNPSGSAIAYATFIGGSDADVGSGIAVDALGNAYVVGYTLSTDFPTAAALQPSNAGSIDGFIVKLRTDGALLAYASYLGGSSDDFANAVAVTAAGSARVAGSTYSANFPKILPTQALLGGDSDAFVSYFNIAGSALTFSTFLGGLGTDLATGIALDANGAAYVVGSTASGNFPRVGAFQNAFGGGAFDAFVSKLGATSGLIYSSYLGGSGRDEATAVAVDHSNAALVVGSTASDGFPGASLGFQATRGGGDDAFVSKVDSTGALLTFSSYLGGAGSDQAQGVAVDARDSIVVVGATGSTNFPTLLPNQPTNAGGSDAFVSKLLVTGPLDYSTYFGGSATDRAFAVASNGNGDIGVVGSTVSTDFPTRSALYATRLGSQDAFVLKVPGLNNAPLGVSPLALLLVLICLALAALSLRRRAVHT